uniref:Solute carrier organic anion transporter family member n=1 Tax=Saccoglossus kowalevskii TaxID=10224 RepID=A0ABM0GU38_SACKO|nr:PREDICTED: solute carrier organic anion transporter family member 4C1-like [Saccoglossus kowalevskii]
MTTEVHTNGVILEGMNNPALDADADDDDDSRSTNSIPNVEYEEEAEPFLCGWFSIRPKWLQRFNTAPGLALAVSLLMFVQGMAVSGFAFVSLTSIETRFQLSSTATGLILSTYDITGLIAAPIVSYFGAMRNKPRWLSVGAIIMGFGFFIWTLPHFTTGDYGYEVSQMYEPICDLSDDNSTFVEICDDEWTSLSYYFWVFVIAQVIVAIGASPIYNLGLAFVDEHVSTRDSGWYVGVTHAFAVLGPVTGFILGAVFLSIWTDIKNADSVTITPDDPAWVGAWWLGFLLSWILAWLVSIPIGAYPPELPVKKEIEKERRETAHHSDQSDNIMKMRPEFGKDAQDLWPSTKILLTNPAFMFVCAAQCSQNLLLSGAAPFMPKFLENQFSLTSTQGAALVGITALPSAVVGTVLGGWIIQRFNLGVKGTLRFCIFIGVFTLCGLPIFLIHCPQPDIAGVFVSYDPITELEEVNLNHPCNLPCNCSTSSAYSPVCGINNLVYFDGCYAGCQTTLNEGETFSDCRCIFADNNTNPNATEAVSGKCIQSCSVPGPIIFGAIIDSACVVWQQTCDTTGSCWIYDNFLFGMKIFIAGVIFMGLTCLFLVFALVCYKPPEDDHVVSEVIPGPTYGNNYKEPTSVDEDSKGVVGVGYKQKYSD